MGSRARRKCQYHVDVPGENAEPHITTSIASCVEVALKKGHEPPTVCRGRLTFLTFDVDERCWFIAGQSHWFEIPRSHFFSPHQKVRKSCTFLMKMRVNNLVWGSRSEEQAVNFSNVTDGGERLPVRRLYPQQGGTERCGQEDM